MARRRSARVGWAADSGNLHELRHKADYVPQYECDTTKANQTIVNAQEATKTFRASTLDQHEPS
jgi:hypothetical protein